MTLLWAITELNKKEQNVSHMGKVHLQCSRESENADRIIVDYKES